MCELFQQIARCRPDKRHPKLIWAILYRLTNQPVVIDNVNDPPLDFVFYAQDIC